ncbi:MAG: hypothetical protein BRD50_00400 [Bacteroidetes bacterium SW_11_45_7]|nr:MAG: hypothetical protein BRD50_00400 [Bacteroidetes bacterium SW_11_45_7]
MPTLQNSLVVKFLGLQCCLLTFFLVVPHSLSGAEGDTTIVHAHDDVDMTWHGNYDEWAVFPDSSKSYHKILMYYTMGCSSSGCSDWDYTTKIELLKPTGRIDSNISSVDTVSTNPVVTDTNWTKFEVSEPFELARVITPYGGYMANNQNGYSNSWQHTFVFDVTDFAPLLRDSVKLRAFYGGWSDGFSVSLRFQMIEGTPPRDVVSIANVWRRGGGGWTYDNATSFDSTHLPQKEVWLPQEAKAASMRVIPTGHEFDNNVNCAEFCKKNYQLHAEGSQIADQPMWRSDCGRNPIFPQGGTWLYDRANWCPGDRATIYKHAIGRAFSAGDSISLDMDIDNISWSGSDAPSYIIDAQLFTYSDPNFQLDASLEDIIAPSSADRHARENPICTNPVVEIKNTGEDTLKNLLFAYGVQGGDTCRYRWNGKLAFMEEQQVELPLFNWTSLDTSNPTFYASISAPNYGNDEYALNNHLTSSFSLPPVYDSTIIMEYATNGAADETAYTFQNQEGTVLYSRDTFPDNLLVRDTFHLSKGRYVFTMTDSDEDGIDFFANNDGSVLSGRFWDEHYPSLYSWLSIRTGTC